MASPTAPVQPSEPPVASLPESSKINQQSTKSHVVTKIIVGIMFLALVISIMGNVYLYKQTATSADNNDSLTKQNISLTNQVQDLGGKVKQYLSLQGEKCDQESTACLNSLIVRLKTKPALSVATGGMCIVRDAYTNMPSSSDPDVGKGYAKLTKKDINTVTDLQKSCGQSDYAKLMQSYCAQNKNPVQFGVAPVNKFGGVEASSCSSFGCGSVSCPQR